MSSFFTIPVSQRKRVREDYSLNRTPKKRKDINAPGRSSRRTSVSQKREESVSGSDTEDDEGVDRLEENGHTEQSHSEGESETIAERRVKLAERYLENIRKDVDETGYDAADLERHHVAARLKEDVAERKGLLYRHLASTLSIGSAAHVHFRLDEGSVTAIAAHQSYVYTVSKDMTLSKWELPVRVLNAADGPQENRVRTRPRRVAYVKGNKRSDPGASHIGHTSRILCVAVSSDGRFVATGGQDRRLIIWDSENLAPLKVFTQHRDAVTSLAFRRGSNQLYSCSKDRTVKIWSLDELAYVETLFGHQDDVVDVAALAAERCVTVGARDRTARLWKVVEESQLVFRGGGSTKVLRRAHVNGDSQATVDIRSDSLGPVERAFQEGSVDRVAMIDEESFVTGGDSGSISLWSIQKKKPVFTVPVAHGLDKASPEGASTQVELYAPEASRLALPRWITALATIPYSDLVLSGSWDGQIRLWRVSEDKRRLEAVGRLGSQTDDAEGLKSLEHTDADHFGRSDHGIKPKITGPLRGVVNDIAVFEKGPQADGICVVAAVGKEHRLGRWLRMKGKPGTVAFEIPRRNVQQSGS